MSFDSRKLMLSKRRKFIRVLMETRWLVHRVTVLKNRNESCSICKIEMLLKNEFSQ